MIHVQALCSKWSKTSAPVMENVERRSWLHAANFPYLPVLGTPTSALNQHSRRREEEVGTRGSVMVISDRQNE